MNSYYFFANETAQYYGYDRTEDLPEGTSQPRRMGLIAQEIQSIEPNLVEELPHIPGYYTINYPHLNALLIEALKELDARAEAAKVSLGITT